MGLTLCVAVVCAQAAEVVDGRGWGSGIDWYKYEDAKEVSAQTGKPLMVVIHKSWCGACKRLKPLFSASQEIKTLSKNFVMTNVEDDEEPQGEMFAPDGGYIPRILFFNKDFERMDVINEEGNPQYKYFYSDAEQVVSAMKRANK